VETFNEKKKSRLHEKYNQ